MRDGQCVITTRYKRLVMLVKLRRAVRSAWFLELLIAVVWLANVIARLWRWLSSYWPGC